MTHNDQRACLLEVWHRADRSAVATKPFGRVHERVYLHSCRLCLFYDPRLTRKCREQDAEEVSDTERANFCAYFKVKLGDLRPGGESRTQTTRARLGELFGADEKSDEKPES